MEVGVVNRVFWLFGRSGAGKTTLATRLRQGLGDRGLPVFFIDGDEARGGLSSDLGYQARARTEQHRRVAEVAKLACGQGILPVVATMAPEHAQRDIVGRILGERLVWVFVEAPFEECLRRDPKGLYRRARSGELQNLIEYPFDPPKEEERRLTVQTRGTSIEASYQKLLEGVLAELPDRNL